MSMTARMSDECPRRACVVIARRMTSSNASSRAPATARGGVAVPAHVLAAIYGDDDASSARAVVEKADDGTRKGEAYDESLRSWWRTYSERKNDEEEEHVADSLLYDYRHLPRTTPAPNFREDRLAPTPTTTKETK